jgi:Ca2+-binding RTX toxin-like protein
MSAKKRTWAKLRLEELERRDLLTVSVSGLGDPSGILTFTGDDASDRVEIVDTGLAGAGQLRYRINGGAWVTSPNEVWRVALNLGGGNDTVDYNIGRSFDAIRPGGLGTVVNGKVAGLYREIEANLGDGDDTFNATVHGNVVGPNGMRILANGQRGNDRITATLNGDVRGSASMGFSFQGGDIDQGGDPSRVGVDFITVNLSNDVDVDSSSLIWINMWGGGGNDNQQIHYQGELDGKLLLHSEGGAGDDWLVADLALDAGSQGSVGDPDAPNTFQGNWNRVAQLFGQQGNDSIDFLVTLNVLATIRSIATEAYAGADNDRMRAGSVGVRLFGEAGNDELTGGAGNDYLDGGDGNDAVYGNAGNDVLYGGAGDDAVYGEAGNDALYGGGGNDWLRGGDDNDTIYGQDGDDSLIGDSGNDVEDGGAGTDRIWEVADTNMTLTNTSLSGGTALGTDMLSSIEYAELIGGAGDTVLNASGFTGPVTLRGEGGNDLLLGGSRNDMLLGGDGNDTIYGNGGNDTIFGQEGNDTLVGDAGDDALYGEAGNDVLYGSDGNDILDGGADYDTLSDKRAQMFNGEEIHISVDSGYPQDDGWSCGPNSATRFLRNWGFDVSYEQMKDLAKDATTILDIDLPWPLPDIHVSLTDLGLGVPPPALQSMLQQFKPDVNMEQETSFDRVLDVLGQGKPVIALLKVGEKQFLTEGIPLLHYVVLTGFDMASQTLYYTDTNGGSYSMSYAQFNDQWNWSDGGLFRPVLKLAGVNPGTIIY